MNDTALIPPDQSPPDQSPSDKTMGDTKWQGRFFAFFGAQAVSLIGSNIAQFAITWWLARSLESATVLANATLMALLPGILLGPLVGVLVDRWPRRLIIMAADAVGALGAAVLMILFWSDAIQIWHIYLITFVRALAGTFHFAAVQASTTLMVPTDQLGRVGGMNQMVQGFNMLAAPPLGALFLEWFALEGMMAIDVVTALIAIGLVFLIKIPQPLKSESENARPTILADLRTGFLYIWHWPSLFMILLMCAVLNFLFTPAFTLLPLLVLNHFDGNALTLAWLNTLFGVGLVVGGLLLGAWGGFKSKMLTAIFGLALSSIGTFLMGFAPPEGYWMALVGLGIFGVFNTIANGSFMALMQAVVAPEMQGRFFTVLMSIVQVMSPIGLLIAGPVADRFGIQLWYVVAAFGMLAMSAAMFFTPALRSVEDRYIPQVQGGDGISQLPTPAIQGE